MLLCALVACKSAVTCDPPAPGSANVIGSWSYAATQNAPTSANLAGTMLISTQCGSTVTGSLDVTETDGSGSRRLAGTLSGRVVDSQTVDFDVFFTTVGRRHVGTLAADSMRGTWIEPGDLGSSSGAFAAAKTP